MKTETLHTKRRVALCATLCLTALLGLLAVGCGDKASEGGVAAPSAPAVPAVGSAPSASATGGRRTPGNPNPNEAANAAAFEAARKKAEGK